MRNFTKADMGGINLHNADLSGATGLVDPSTWLIKNFESDKTGILVYKSFAALFTAHWPEPKPGLVISETVNSDRATECGSGVHFGTKRAVSRSFPNKVWLCCIRWSWLPSVIVPYNTRGFARCGWLEVIRPLEKKR